MIYGDQVRLRPISRDDLPRFVTWFNDPEFRAGISRIHPLSLEEEERWFNSIQDLPMEERPFSIDVLEKKKWVHIGSCGLFRFNSSAHNCEMGIGVGDRERWGKGYGTSVTRVLLRHAFDSLNLHRVYLRVFAYNTRAQRVYQKLGFMEEGRLREDRFFDGEYHDTIIMGILRDEWISGGAREG